MSAPRLTAAVALLGIAGIAYGEPGKTDLDRIQGTWTLVRTEPEAKPPEKGGERLDLDRVVVKGSYVIVFLKGASGKADIALFTIKLDPEARPRTVDLTQLTDETAGATSVGIYELAGDTLRLCFLSQTLDPKARPAAFPARPAADVPVTVFKRAGR